MTAAYGRSKRVAAGGARSARVTPRPPSAPLRGLARAGRSAAPAPKTQEGRSVSAEHRGLRPRRRRGTTGRAGSRGAGRGTESRSRRGAARPRSARRRSRENPRGRRRRSAHEVRIRVDGELHVRLAEARDVDLTAVRRDEAHVRKASCEVADLQALGEPRVAGGDDHRHPSSRATSTTASTNGALIRNVSSQGWRKSPLRPRSSIARSASRTRPGRGSGRRGRSPRTGRDVPGRRWRRAGSPAPARTGAASSGRRRPDRCRPPPSRRADRPPFPRGRATSRRGT